MFEDPKPNDTVQGFSTQCTVEEFNNMSEDEKEVFAYGKEEMIKRWSDELIELASTHEFAWNTYGSELCAGDMLRKEEELRNKIKVLEEGD
jgi:hypothetical protein